MPTTIDIENAKQIRQPMQVNVTLEAYNSLPTLTFSGYQTTEHPVKLATYSGLGNDYPMRVLTDLQGDGFPLDESCVLYDSTQAESEINGKIGVRGTINDDVGVRVQLSADVEMITVRATGATSVTDVDRSKTYTIDNGEVLVPISNDHDVHLLFNHGGLNNQRIEVSEIRAGFLMNFTNEDLISVNLNLRSDLQPIDPSLPESEIEIKVYYPNDISAALTQVADNKPITYQAGYDTDLSDTRRFYISEPPTWNNNVLTIKGVDLVNKLDNDTFPFFIGGYSYGNYTNNIKGVFRKLYSVMADQIWMGGINLINYEQPPAENADGSESGQDNQNSIVKRQSQRDVIANFMNLLHQDYTSGFFNIDSFWPTYVDAGIPSLSWTKPSVKWDIYEEDCGDLTHNAARKIASITIPNDTVRSLGFRQVKMDGSASAFKNSGIGLTFSDMSTYQQWWYYGDTRSERFAATEYDDVLDLPIDPQYGSSGGHPYLNSYIYGTALYDNNVGNNKKLNIKYSPFYEWENWTAANTTSWNNLVNAGEVESDATSITLEAVGRGFVLETNTKTETQQVVGVDEVTSKTAWHGVMRAKNVNTSSYINIVPGQAIKNLLSRSNITGSFTWKGDPRMQPRDFFNFHRLDGTVEVCTIETIALTHDKGGTQAEITYRKGKV